MDWDYICKECDESYNECVCPPKSKEDEMVDRKCKKGKKGKKGGKK
jgi:hypothetical protein